MKLLVSAPKGTKDILPQQTAKWQAVEKALLDTAETFGFQEIRIPTFEYTELFVRSVGDTTDVVQKEMFTFEDRGGRSLTLKPEGTAGVVRAALENGLLGDALPLKLCYILPCFRNERPQAGRFKEFHQFGVEMFGSAAPAADAQLIALGQECLELLGVSGVRLELNSIGCKTCRAAYQEKLKDYFNAKKQALCPTCLERLEKNPMRLLDCKNEACAAIAKDAPNVLDSLCEDCKTHFDGVKRALDDMGVAFTVNPKIVRGLDYYTRTVFEFVSDDLGAQSTVCGGGRYDRLVEEMGGKPTPALGFAMGLERLMMILESQNISFDEPKRCAIYIANVGDAAAAKALALTAALRKEGFFAECDVMDRSLKAQMKYADKLGAELSMVIGEDELKTGKAQVKDMASGETREAAFEELPDLLYQKRLDQLTRDIEGLIEEPAPENKG